jgi:hypothetical protein
MLPTKFRFIWPSGFRGEDFFKSAVLKAAERNKHFRVSVNEEQYQIGQQKFSSLDQLIDHYKKHPIFKQENEKLYLVKPFKIVAQ